MNTGTPGTFADTAKKRYTRSWFNRPPKGLQNSLLATTADVGTSFVEVDQSAANHDLRFEFILWSGEALNISASGRCSNSSAGSTNYGSFGIDGVTVENSENSIAEPIASYGIAMSLALIKEGLSEGYHYAQVIAKRDIGALLFDGAASAGTSRWNINGLIES